MWVRGVCPRCSAEIEPDSSLALDETLLFNDSPHSVDDQAERARIPLEVRGEDELDRLVGTRLYVYQCESLLGRGGMGRVYLARHSHLDRRCALKILSPRVISTDVDYVERFQFEGRATASLNHPNIVTIHSLGEYSGHHYLEMELVAGRTLQQLIQDEGRLTPVRATLLAARIAEGLGAAHRAGIVHRDLKPDNVLLTHQGIPKIADFGLAKRIMGGDDPRGILVGTPNFMAPELFEEEPATPASDIYALGVCYYLMLTGSLPFVAGSLPALRERVLSEPVPSVRQQFPDISLEMAECVHLLMAKSPANRPAGGFEAAQLLMAVAGQTRDVESLLTEAFQGTQFVVSWVRNDDRYRVNLTLPDGRRQTVFVEPSDHAAADRLLLLYSVCCEVRPAFYEEALRLNWEIPHGGMAIRDIDGVPMFVMMDTYPRATVDPEEIRRSLLEVAFRADAMEKLLTGADRH